MGSTTPDYSQRECWYRVLEITKDVDTFYIYSTVYMGANEDDPDYATIDNAEMLAGVAFEYVTKTSVFEDSTNVFVPYYRQASARCAGEARKNTGAIASAVKELPYDDISAACAPVPLPEFMGPDSRHDNDYGLYYNNVKENVAKRIAVYLAK